MPAGAWVARSVVQPSSGLTINYKVGLPAGTVTGFPIDVCLAGSAERGTDNTSQLTWGGALYISGLLTAGTYTGICVAPQIPNDATAGPVGHECIPLMVAATVAEWGADATRVALNGSSYGGSFAAAHMRYNPTKYSCLVLTPGVILASFSNGTPDAPGYATDAIAGAAHIAAYGHAPVRMFTGDTDATYTPALQNTTAGYFTSAGAERFGQRGGNGLLPFVSDHASTPTNAFADGTLLKWMHQQRRVDTSNARSYDYTKAVVIDHTKVGGASVTGFVAKVAGTDADLKSTGSGGKSTSAGGFDHAYFLDAALTERLSAELCVVFSPTTGKYEDYVNLGTSALSTVADTTVYLGLGNAAVTADQSDAGVTVWGANHKGVFHFGDGTSVVLTDSSGNGNSLTNNGLTATTDATGGAVAGNGTSQNAQMTTGAILTTEPGTISAVFNPSETTTTGVIAACALNTPISPSVFMELIKRPTGVVRASRWDGVAGASANADSTATYTASAANYAAAVFTSNASRSVYVNSAAAVTNATALNASPAAMDRTAIAAVYINTAPGAFFAGSIAEARFSNVARSAAWLLTEYNNLVGGPLLSVGAAVATQVTASGTFLFLRRRPRR